jgi:acyl-CoA-binding protein
MNIEKNFKETSGNSNEEKKKKESIYTMEIGRLKERLIEVTKVLPEILKIIAKLNVEAWKSLGKSDEEIKKENDKILEELFRLADTVQTKGDERFNKNTNQN